ncbi:MAG: S-formylglutathione hydrolase [Pseudomonadota bacterium]
MLECLNEHRCFGGSQRFYRHASSVIGLSMRFSVYLPPLIEKTAKVPALLFLAGLTCTEETFMIKAHAQRFAAQVGIALITVDTSPRGAGIVGEDEDWDFGTGAGFYLDATLAPWNKHYRMYSYLTQELPPLIFKHFPIDTSRVGVFGHSMGGHGALVLALRNPRLFTSVSAFAPIAAPMLAPWGQKAFKGYLGEDQSTWEQYDASVLMAQLNAPFPNGILIDQGLEDKFLKDQLFPEVFENSCQIAKQPLFLRQHEGYDHGYYFISTFIEDHILFHAKSFLHDVYIL